MNLDGVFTKKRQEKKIFSMSTFVGNFMTNFVHTPKLRKPAGFQEKSRRKFKTCKVVKMFTRPSYKSCSVLNFVRASIIFYKFL